MKSNQTILTLPACMTETRQRCVFPFLFNENDDIYNRRCAKNDEVCTIFFSKSYFLKNLNKYHYRYLGLVSF